MHLLRRFAFLFLCLPVLPVMAQAAPAISVGSTTAPPGANISIPVTLTNDGSAVAMQFTITYDTGVLTAGTPTLGNAAAGHTLSYAENTPGQIRIVISPPPGNPALGSGVLLDLPFTVNAAAVPGTYPLDILGALTADITAASVTTTVTNGALTIPSPNSAPVANAGPDQTVDEGMSVTLDGSASTDNDGSITSYAWSQTAGPAVTLGSTNTAVTTFTAPQVSADQLLSFRLTVTDDQGATGSTTVNVTVRDLVVLDTTAPVVTPPADITVEATGITTPVSLGTATATDDVDGALIPTADQSGPFALGLTTVTWSATDAAGNTGTATQQVTVADTTSPVLTVPPDVQVTSDVPLTVDIGSATATDIFSVSISNDAPAQFPLGVTIVTWTATDANGNTTVAQQTVTVSPPATGGTVAFQQGTDANGMLVIDAANFDTNTAQGGDAWVVTNPTGAVSAGALYATPDDGTNRNADYVANAPHLEYTVNFRYAGTHYVWIRAQAPDSYDNSVHVGLDGQAQASGDRISGFGSGWLWENNTMDNIVATITVDQPGIHTLDIWMREDGFEFDRILLTTDAGYVPTGIGPAQSHRGEPLPTVDTPAFSVAPGNYVGAQSVALSTTTPGAVIHYTLDGSEPTTASPQYTGALTINRTMELRARAFLDGYIDSAIAGGTYRITGGAWQQDTGAAGLVVFDVAGFETNTDGSTHTWITGTRPGNLGPYALYASPDNGTNNNTGYVGVSPRLSYRVNFVATGTHYIWVHAYAPDTNDDSVHIGLDGQAVGTADRISGFGHGWLWSRETMDGTHAEINIPTPGIHTIDVWMREDGFEFDRIIITTDPSFVPTGDGGAVSGYE